MISVHTQITHDQHFSLTYTSSFNGDNIHALVKGHQCLSCAIGSPCRPVGESYVTA